MGWEGQHRRVRLKRREPTIQLPGVLGVARPARVGAQDPAEATRALARRVGPGDVVVLDHIDLDRVSAETLAAAHPGAVVNVRRSLSGRQPARGAAVLVAAGIPLVDDTGPALLSEVRDGERIRVHEGAVYTGERLLGQGTVLTSERVEAAEAQARSTMAGRLEAVGSDAAEFLRDHEGLLLEGDGLPEVDLDLADRFVLVVAPGERAARELRDLRRWVRDRRPLVVSAGEGTAVALAAGLRPALVVGDVPPDGGRRLNGAEQVAPDRVPAGLSTMDLAVGLALAGDARLVVVAGAPASFEELLDRERGAAAALLAVRLHGGERVVDAPAVAALHESAVAVWPALLLLVAGVVALVVALLAVPGGHELLHRLREALPW